jgi:hypothetical protein
MMKRLPAFGAVGVGADDGMRGGGAKVRMRHNPVLAGRSEKHER